jgi:hypothetical protein
MKNYEKNIQKNIIFLKLLFHQPFHFMWRTKKLYRSNNKLIFFNGLAFRWLCGSQMVDVMKTNETRSKTTCSTTSCFPRNQKATFKHSIYFLIDSSKNIQTIFFTFLTFFMSKKVLFLTLFKQFNNHCHINFLDPVTT